MTSHNINYVKWQAPFSYENTSNKEPIKKSNLTHFAAQKTAPNGAHLNVTSEIVSLRQILQCFNRLILL